MLPWCEGRYDQAWVLVRKDLTHVKCVIQQFPPPHLILNNCEERVDSENLKCITLVRTKNT